MSALPRKADTQCERGTLGLVLVGFDVVVLYDLAPRLHLIGDEGAHCFRTAEGKRHLLRFNQLLGDALLTQGGRHLMTETLDDRLWRASRREDAPPGVSFETREAALRHGGHLRDKLVAFLP